MERDIPDTFFIMKPWLTENTLAMISSSRGVGKTFFCLSIAMAITRGVPIGSWVAENPVGCLYIDGEMPVVEMKARIEKLSKSLPEAKAVLHLLSVPLMRMEGKPPFSLGNPEWFSSINKYLEQRRYIKVLIIDNLSSLSYGMDEDRKLSWDPIGQWLLSLRSMGIAVIMVHHTGKSGDQRGTSAREDHLDVSISLTHPSNYDPTVGVRFNVEFSKARHLSGEDATPFCFQILSSGQGTDQSLIWQVSDNASTAGSLEKGVIELLLQGTKQKDIADRLGCTPIPCVADQERCHSEGIA